jgi:hypothetical protein
MAILDRGFRYSREALHILQLDRSVRNLLSVGYTIKYHNSL